MACCAVEGSDRPQRERVACSWRRLVVALGPPLASVRCFMGSLVKKRRKRMRKKKHRKMLRRTRYQRRNR